MKVYVERCWGGGDRYSFRCTVLPGRHGYAGHRVVIPSKYEGYWTREDASELRDILEMETGVNRDSIKIIHH